MKAGVLDQRLLIEEKTVARDPVYNAEVVTWLPIATVWASLHDVLLSQAEKTGQKLQQGQRPTRIRMRYRDDVTLTCRFTHQRDGRVMQVTSVAEVGRREGLEILAVNYATEGQGG